MPGSDGSNPARALPAQRPTGGGPRPVAAAGRPYAQPAPRPGSGSGAAGARAVPVPAPGARPSAPAAATAGRPRPASPLQTLRRFFRTPKGTLLLVLVALAALASLPAGHRAPAEVAAPALTAAVADLIVTRWRRGRWAFPSGAILSGMLVGMILSPLGSPADAAATAAIAIGGKHLLRTRWSNIFNPAALALVACTRLFPSAQSWWGALPTLGLPGFAVLLAGGWIIAAKVGKLPAALSFLGTALGIFTLAAFLGAATHVVQVFRSSDIQMLVFFAAFMLIDPPTSPARAGDQVWFGALVGAASAALFLWFGVQWFPLGGLLLGNAAESLRRVLVQGRRKKVPPTRPTGPDARRDALRDAGPRLAGTAAARLGGR